MVDADLLLSDLQAELIAFTADLVDRVRGDEEVRSRVEGEWRKAFDANRTGRTFEDWLDDRLTQVAVGWILACVFVRFGEDNGLIDEARIAGPDLRGREARDAQQRYFVEHPHSNDREYLNSVFRAAAELRGLDGVVGEGESPLWLVDPPADAATRLLTLFRSADDDGRLRHDFTDPELSTRFLGDLYQDLSEHAKSTYALLQTPEFVEEFILDRTLTPAIDTFGLANTTLIDPTCGSGHFLLGAFHRLFQGWRAAEPNGSEREHAERALAAVTGVDLNPFAAAIARFRLLVAAVKASHVSRLADAPDFTIGVAVGDSLLWGARPGQLSGMEAAATAADRQFLYATEHAEALRRIFDRQYTAVVGNPPYIVCRDAALNQQYRDRYKSCHRQYSLGVPFTEKFFDLAVQPDNMGRPAGYVGMITANSFMKREFGKKLIEQFIPTWDLTHVVDTSGAYIPGHGTPTVILFGRHQRPASDTVRAVMAIRGEPSTPPDAAKGSVWSAITAQIDEPGSESDFVSVADTARERFGTHPWSIGGGGAAELKERIEAASDGCLEFEVEEIGFGAVTREDDVFRIGCGACRRAGIGDRHRRSLVAGEELRDWAFDDLTDAIWPYDPDTLAVVEDQAITRLEWPWRTQLSDRVAYGKTQLERGLKWFEYSMFFRDRFRTPLSISVASVATHNHFVLDRGGKVFKQSAPLIKMAPGSTEQDHLGLLGLLNSSLACFWMKQVFHKKGTISSGTGGLVTERWEPFYDIDGTKLRQFPLPQGPRPVALATVLDGLATRHQQSQPKVAAPDVPTRAALDEARVECERLFAMMVAAQEELDWECLHLFGLTEEPLTAPEGREAPPLQLGERAFEIILARKVAAGEAETAWFSRHRSTPITEIPSHWPDWYRDLVQRRIDLIESDRDVGLVERPEHKRRWAREPWEKLEERALRGWLQDRLEDRRLWFEGSGDQERAVCRSVAQLADKVTGLDPDFLEVARVWKGVVEVDPVQIVAELVADEHVPAQSAARYKGKGFDKRRQWERTWDLQRMEDRGEPLPDGLERIPVPPKYAQADFAKPSFWKQRGKLDVPKERFTSIWGAERDADPTLVLAWAGFDHAQMAQAIGTLLVDRQQTDGWDPDRSWPLVVALAELLPWLNQWHHDVVPAWGDSPAAIYRALTEQQALAGDRPVAAARDSRIPMQPPRRPTRQTTSGYSAGDPVPNS